MNRIKFLTLAALAVLVFAVTGCKDSVIIIIDEEPKVEPQEEPKVDIKKTLASTKWKLVGFFDVEKDELVKPVPEDCDTCYTIQFGPRDKDTTCYDSGIPEFPVCSDTSLTVWGESGGATTRLYSVDNARSLIIPKDWWYSSYDNDRVYLQAFERSDAGNIGFEFELTGSELMIYYNDRKNYLLFEQINGCPVSVIWPEP